MAGDRARISYDPARKYRELVTQQGRAVLDADLNEGQRIFTEEMRHHAIDFVGPCGTPDDGYRVSAPPIDFQIGPGTMYVGGLRTTLEQPITYSAQPDWLDTALPQPWTDIAFRPVDALGGSNSHVMLVLREQEITAVEDPALREVALGGPDTDARTRLLQRIVAASTDASTCDAAAAAMPAFWSQRGLIFDPATAELRPRARLRLTLITDPPSPSPCDPPAASGYLGADNQLIRVQVVAYDDATRKGKLLWGFHNASTLYRCEALDPTTLELATRPVSPEYQPRAGQVVQVLLAAAELENATAAGLLNGAYAAALTGHHAKLTAPYAPDTRLITLPGALPAVIPQQQNSPPLFVRLWEDEVDFERDAPVTLAQTGLQVTISGVDAGPLHPGDVWSIAVRPLTPNAVYPERYLAAPQPPDGARMWVCSLAVLLANATGAALHVDDCRTTFDPLTEPGDGTGTDCCCVRVTPSQAGELQSIINAAVGQAGAVQVAIHLEPGIYVLQTPLVLDARHKGLTIEPCAGAPVLTGTENKSFAHGLIWALGVEDVTIRGLDFQVTAQIIPDDVRNNLVKVRPDFDFLLQFSVGIRAIQCLSLTVQGCHFRIAGSRSTFSAGILVQGDNGRIESLQCRFTGEAANEVFLAFGICLAPVLLDDSGRLQTSSAEVLRVTGSEFSFVDTGIVLSSRALYVSVEENVTRLARCSLSAVWYDDKVQHVRDFFAVLNTTQSKSEVVKKFGTDFIEDRPSLLATGMPLLLSLGELKGLIDISKRTRVYTLGDTAIDAVGGFTLSAPTNLRLTVRGNQFESTFLDRTISSGVDTLVWEVNSSTAFVTITGNTMWSFSDLPTVAVLNGRGFDVTGNVLGNAFAPTADRGSLALIVNPGSTRGTPDAPINMFTISGNTIFGMTNLADFVRQEWRVQLPQEFAPLLTWEFFNTIG